MKNKYPRLLVVLSALILSIGSLWAVPAYRGWRTMTQPDGTTITIRQMGDEFFHYWENEEGQQVEKLADGWWRVKETPSEQSEISKKKQASRSYNKAPGTPRKSAGTINLAPRGLVILVNFSDVTYKSGNTQSAMSDLMNSANYTYNSATGSVREFFKAQSNGAYVPDFDVAGPYTLSNNRAYYGGNDDSGNDKLPGNMVVEACKLADADGVDFTQYNNDGDSYVDFVYIIYAGVGEADSGVEDAVWPHNWTLSSAQYYNNCTYSASQSKVDGLYIENYACSGELEGSATYRCPIGTIAHEFGHVLGLPDYYVTSETAANYNKKYTPGSWHIMDYGSYNNDGRTPPNYSPHDKYYFGWSTPTLLKKDEKKNCTLTTAYGSAYQITGTTSAAQATSTSRVWYLEDRQKSGWDRYLPGHGMVVWEVQYNSSNWTGNTPNNTSVGYTVVTANSLERPYTPYVYNTTASSTSGTPFPGTSKVTSYSPSDGCDLTSITESSGNITFLYNGGITCHDVVVNGAGCTIEPSSTCVEDNTQLTATITPTDATYDFTSLTVTRGSTTLTSGTYYTLSSDKKSLTINASAISGSASDAITITAVWTKNRYSYEFVSQDCTVPADGAVSKNAELNLTITPSSGYTLADAACWEVEMGGVELVYGTGFTYTGTTFNIPSVTGDVVIMANALHPVTWYADGNALHAKNVAVDGKITLPATDPANCASGKVFVGWCTESNYSNATTAPTFAKTGDTYSVATYYAVYATVANSAPRRAKMAENSATYTFTSSSWAATEGNWTSGTAGAGYNNSGVQVTTGATGANATCPSSYDNISSIVVSYCTNSSKGAGTIVMSVGLTQVSQSVSTSGGTSARDLTFDFSSTKPSGSPKITVNCTTNSIYVCGVTINYGDGGSYTDYSTACGTPCSNTPEMSFTNSTVNKTTADANFTQAVNISGKGSGQTVAYSSSDATVATVDNAGAVTLKGKVGSTTITASVAADGEYCAASASYTLNVTAAPIDVTLHYNNSSATFNNQTPPYTLPTGSPYNTAMCDGDWTFDGWYGSTYTKSTQKPTYITELTTDGSAAYAVYKTTETSGSGGSSSVVFNFGYSADWGQNASWSGSDKNSVTATKGGVTITHTRGSGSIYANSTATRFYKDNTLTFSVETGSITSIVFTCSTYQTDITSDVGTCTATSSEFSWSGDASSVSFSRPSSASSYAQFSAATITIGGGGGSTTYYATTPECVTGCTITPTMSFANETVTKTTDDATYTQAVTISGKGDGQTVAYSSSDATVATVDNSGVVTLLGKVGSTTITASVEANGDYCAASASYTLNVTAAPISVTLYYNNSTATLNNLTPPYTLPTGSPYNTAMCDGDWTFAGWYGSTYDKSETAPDYVTQLSATGSVYAVYTTTETVSNAPVRMTAASVGTTLWAEDFSGYSGGDVPSGTAANSHTGTTVFDNGSVVYSVTNGGGTTKLYAESNAGGASPELLIAKGDGTFSISGIPTGDATAMTLTFGTNKTSGISVSSGTTGISVGSVTISSGTATCEITNTGNVDAFDLTITNTNSSNSREDDFLLVVKTAGSGSGGGGSSSVTYYATTPECVTGCTITPTMSFANDTVTKTTAEATYAQVVTISDKGDGQTVAYSSSDATVATVDNSGVVTLKGKVGSTTITASVEADGDYCAASASYTLNVTAAPIDVTLYYSGTSETLNDQTNPYTLPTTGKYVANMCDDAWTFAGWCSSEYAKSTQKPTYITELTTDGSAAYAVYKKTETIGSGSATNLIEYNGVDGRSTLEAIEGVTTNSVADYAAANSPYLLKFDGTGDYIQFELSVVPTSLSFEYKMIGGANTSTMTIMECATATGDYTDVEALSISGAQNSTGSLTTSNSFSKKYIRMVFTKGSNVGVGSITIVGGGSTSTTYYATTPDCAVTCNLTSISLNTTSAKKTFYVGESFTHDGVVITANYSNCDSKTVNGFYTVPDMSSAGTKTVNISYTENGVTKEASYEINVVCELTSITLNTTSATTTFDVGDTFTSEGVVVTAHYKSNNCSDQTVNGFYTVPDMSSAGTKTVNVSYTENGVTKETSYDITVVQPVYYTVTWIACGDTIQTETYREGAHLVFPTSPGANAGKAFYGWTTTQHYTGTSAPPIISEGGEVHANATYYAVYE